MQRPVSFSRLLEHLAGREDATVARLLEAGTLDSTMVQTARHLLASGRRAFAHGAPTQKALRRARKIFLEHKISPEQTPRSRARGTLQLVLDTLLGAIPSVRSQTATAPRFMRFAGDWTLELQIIHEDKGITLRGQVTPATRATAVTAASGHKTRRATIAADGTFLLRGLPARPFRLDFGEAGSVDIDP